MICVRSNKRNCMVWFHVKYLVTDDCDMIVISQSLGTIHQEYIRLNDQRFMHIFLTGL